MDRDHLRLRQARLRLRLHLLVLLLLQSRPRTRLLRDRSLRSLTCTMSTHRIAFPRSPRLTLFHLHKLFMLVFMRLLPMEHTLVLHAHPAVRFLLPQERYQVILLATRRRL